MDLNDIVDLVEKATAHLEAGDMEELEVTFKTFSSPGVVQTGTYEPPPPPIEEDP